MDKEEARNKVAGLVEKYELIKKSGRIKSYNEAETCKEFILPLFNALGWNTESKEEVSAEEHTSAKDRSDYGFYLNGLAKFYLEAKKLSADIHEEKFAKQATTYSWNKGIDWAVLTDFESLIVFSAQDISEHLSHRLFFEIKHSDYLDNFDQLWWLSKESFEQNLLDKEAEKVGKKLQKVSVTDALYKDLNKCREILIKSFHAWNEDIPNDLLEEGVQKMLDRLIFMRVAEDRKLENPTLLPILRKHGSSSNEEFFKELVDNFRKLDSIYNSNLFSPHPFESWQEYDGATGEVINILHGQQGYYEYDFQAIPADILGSVYENYLGYQLSQSVKGIEVSKNARKRKEQGIYYTPTYIVEYIVSNTLKPLLDSCETIQDLKAIKVLDPACGSGSFLLVAMELIYKKYLEFGAKPGEMTKITILLDNIFGVDLDEQAVEIARLNLLINALDSRMKLPDLSSNIKNGNSLIFGSENELEKAFGTNYKDKKPFNWSEEFPEVFHSGGFDVVIGNPPYVRVDELNLEDKSYWKNKLISTTGKYDLYYLFIEHSLNLLKDVGKLGFIVPNKFCVADSAEKLRRLILDSGSSRFLSVSKVAVFKDASNYPVIFITEKGEKEGVELASATNEEEITSGKINSFQLGKKEISLLPQNLIPINASEDELSLVITLLDGNKIVKDYLKISEGLRIPLAAELDRGELAIVKQFQFERNSRIRPGSYITNESLEKAAGKSSERYINIFKQKILIAEDALRISATIDESSHIPQGGVYFATAKEDYPLKAILAILNSRALSFIYDTLFSGMHMGGGYMRYRTKFLENLPFAELSQSRSKELVLLETKIIQETIRLAEVPENSDKWHSIKSEIKKIDKKIDDLVYNSYKLNSKEVSIIESK